MPLMHLAAIGVSSPSSALILVAVILVSCLYGRGRQRLRAISGSTISGWRLASFLFGLSLIWLALASPLAGYDHDLLTVHMIQHLLLMTVAPPLVLLGEPLLACWNGLPPFGQVALGPLLQRPFARRLAHVFSRPALCWTVSMLALIAWHVPALFTLAMRSELCHSIEQASFLAAGFLFWWPVIQPWPAVSTGPQWSTLLYLFLATLPCDLLSGFLVFADRVAYPVYFSMPRHFGFSVLGDQEFAAALMWTCVTVVYLVPAAILSTRLLSPRSFSRSRLVQSDLSRSAASHSDSPGLGAA